MRSYFFSGKSFVKPNLSSLKGRDRRTWIYMELTYEPIVKQNSRIFHHAPFSSSALCETFKRTQHVSTFCSFIVLALAFITYVGDQCDVFFLTRSFIGIKSMGPRPWSVNFFVWFTLFDVMLPCYLSWWNSSKLVKKKIGYKRLIALKASVRIQVTRYQRFRRGFFTTLCLRGIQDEKRKDCGELETMARQVLF